MKKTGRVVLGTIGLILSLALAGGTVVYGTMFHKNAVAKSEGIIGASTGNMFTDWTKMSGFNNTKALIDVTEGLAEGTAEGTDYTSYSLSFAYNGTETRTEGAETIVNTSVDGVIYTDANYTYVRYIQRVTNDRAIGTEGAEYILVKSSSTVYERKVDPSFDAIATAPGDWSFAESEGWTISSQTEIFPAAISDVGLPALLATVGSENVFAVYPGENKVELAAAEGTEASCRYTLGYAPLVSYSSYSSTLTETLILQYSALNNTKVEAPASLTEVKK